MQQVIGIIEFRRLQHDGLVYLPNRLHKPLSLELQTVVFRCFANLSTPIKRFTLLHILAILRHEQMTSMK